MPDSKPTEFDLTERGGAANMSGRILSDGRVVLYVGREDTCGEGIVLLQYGRRKLIDWLKSLDKPLAT